MAYSREIVYLSDYAKEAAKVRASFGKTDRFKTGIGGLDTYLGGGFGVQDGYEIVVVFGETGVGKSTVAMNLVANEAAKGTEIGYMLLEDDVRHFFLRLETVLGVEKMEVAARSIHMVPKEMLRQMWKLDEILGWIRDKAKAGVTLFVIDHLQFIFENNAEEAKNEYHAQRKFMRDLNALLDEVHATVVIVSHTNKSQAKGMDKIVGSGGIAAAGSKVIGVYPVKGNPDVLELKLHKSRHTPVREGSFHVGKTGYRIHKNDTEEKYLSPQAIVDKIEDNRPLTPQEQHALSQLDLIDP